jgi:LCP family protein required for cell wall assembly
VSQTTKPGRPGRRTVARHGELPTPSPFGQFMTLVAVAVAVVLVAVGGVVAYTATTWTTEVTARAVTLDGESAPPPNIGAIEGGVNLFLAGIDICEKSYAAELGARCTDSQANFTSANNDVDILVHISDNPRRVTVISFPRDLVIPTPSCTRPDGGVTSATRASMLNETYSYGGLSCVVKTVSQLSGVDIPFAAMVTFGGVIQITNAIGGVTVCIANGIKDRYTGLNLPAGNVTIQGLEALQFLRTRHGVGDGGDLGRISNQQQYMSKLARKLVSGGVLSNPATMYKLATVAVDNITPSQSLTNPLTLVQIALAVKSVPFDQMVMVQYPTTPDPTNPNRVVPNYPAASALFAALASNKQLLLSGKPSQGNGVVVEPTAPTASAAPSASATPGASASASPSATANDTVTLPPAIAGTTAAVDTCSNGNG